MQSAIALAVAKAYADIIRNPVVLTMEDQSFTFIHMDVGTFIDYYRNSPAQAYRSSTALMSVPL